VWGEEGECGGRKESVGEGRVGPYTLH